MPEDGVKDRLRIKHSESVEMRMAGQFTYHLFQKLSDIAQASNEPVPQQPFVTSKKLGKVSFKLKAGQSVAARFKWIDEVQQIVATFPSSARYPKWISREQLMTAVDTVVANMSFRG